MDSLPSPMEVDLSPSSSTSHLRALSPLTNLYHRFSSWREALNLPNPGTIENISKEAKATQLTNFFFDGGRADLTKSLSMNPAFQVTHSFSLGSQTAPPSYTFGAVFANNSTFMQGNIDHEGSLSGRFNQGWSAANVSKIQAQLSTTPGHSMIHFEHDYAGRDYSLNAKAINPSPIDATGIYFASYLQSVTKNLALGYEMLMQRPSEDLTDISSSWLARYTSADKSWIGSAVVQPGGVVTASYWQKLSEKLEVAAELQMIASDTRRDAIATLGAKYDLRMASFKAQVDSTGKVSTLLEQRFAPTFAFLVSGEIDHFKNSAKVGVGVMLESVSPEDMAAMQQQQQQQMGMGMPGMPGMPPQP